VVCHAGGRAAGGHCAALARTSRMPALEGLGHADGLKGFVHQRKSDAFLYPILLPSCLLLSSVLQPVPVFAFWRMAGSFSPFRQARGDLLYRPPGTHFLRVCLAHSIRWLLPASRPPHPQANSLLPCAAACVVCLRCCGRRCPKPHPRAFLYAFGFARHTWLYMHCCSTSGIWFGGTWEGSVAFPAATLRAALLRLPLLPAMPSFWWSLSLLFLKHLLLPVYCLLPRLCLLLAWQWRANMYYQALTCFLLGCGWAAYLFVPIVVHTDVWLSFFGGVAAFSLSCTIRLPSLCQLSFWFLFCGDRCFGGLGDARTLVEDVWWADGVTAAGFPTPRTWWL